MKDTIFELKQETSRENITYHFQPNQHFDAIKGAIIKRYKRRVPITTTPIEPIAQLHHDHVGGLPSPPVEEKKVTPTPEPQPEVVVMESPSLPTSNEIREKIQQLKDEKHRLFQILKQMMVEEQNKKREAQLMLQQQLQQQQQQLLLQQQQQQLLLQQQQQESKNNKKRLLEQQQQYQQRPSKKKSRWAPASSEITTSPPASFYNNNSSNNQSSYFYPRPPIPRYNSSHPYSNQQRPRQHHYSLSRPPYSR